MKLARQEAILRLSSYFCGTIFTYAKHRHRVGWHSDGFIANTDLLSKTLHRNDPSGGRQHKKKRLHELSAHSGRGRSIFIFCFCFVLCAQIFVFYFFFYEQILQLRSLILHIQKHKDIIFIASVQITNFSWPKQTITNSQVIFVWWNNRDSKTDMLSIDFVGFIEVDACVSSALWQRWKKKLVYVWK